MINGYRRWIADERTRQRMRTAIDAGKIGMGDDEKQGSLEEHEYTVTRRCRDTYSATVYATSLDDAADKADLVSHWQSHGSEDCETISVVLER